MSTIAYYTATGEVRGDCGHHHRTYAAAVACATRDDWNVVRGHGRSSYSDRTVRAYTATGERVQPEDGLLGTWDPDDDDEDW